MLSDSPPEKDINWSDSGIKGSWKICQKIWNLVCENKTNLIFKELNNKDQFSNAAIQLLMLVNMNLDTITKSIEKFQMNVAIAKIYEIVNAVSKFKIKEKNDNIAIGKSLKILIRTIEPMIPHLAEECWSMLYQDTSIIHEPWPEVDKTFLEVTDVTIVVQINGKRRGEILVKKGITEGEVFNEMKKIKNISDALTGKNILKSIYVPDRIINIVLSQ